MVFKKKETGKLTGSEALEQYAAYHNRLLEWRKLGNAEQAKILRTIYTHCKNGVECLTPGCTTRLSTYNGMQYHLQYCGVPAFERKKQCVVCQELLKSGEMRNHMKRHGEIAVLEEDANSSKDDLNATNNSNGKRGKRKSMLKANELFARLAGSDHNDEAVETKSSKKSKKVNGLEESDEEYSGNETTFENEEDLFETSIDDEREKSKKEKENRKKHKKFTFLNEEYRQEFKLYVQSAYERIISEDHLKIGFEEWIIEKSSWIQLPNCDIEPYVAQYKDRSHPFSWKKSTEKINLNLLESNLSPTDGAIGFCGAPIIACAWSPIPTDEAIQYVAVSTYPNQNLVPFQGEAPGCVQLWSVTIEDKKCTGLTLEFLLSHNYGIVMDLRWCPSGIWQSTDQKSNVLNYSMPRMGALALTSGTGEIAIYGIPHPVSLKCDLKSTTVKIFKAQPFVVLHCGASLISYTLDWSHFNGHEKLAAGFHDGSVSIWNLKKPCELLRDSNNRLLANLSLTVSKAPVRCLRWFSATKILLCSMDRGVSMWDVDGAVCLWTEIPQQVILAVSCGPVLPGYVTSSESSLQLPNYPSYKDIVSQAAIILNRYHQSMIWAFDTSSWNGCILSVDNQGFACVSCIKAVPSEESLKRKFIEKLLLRTVCTTDEPDKNFIPKTYEEAKKCSLQFSYEPKQEMKREQLENEFKRLETTGYYPLAALFAVNWNPNRTNSSWCCFGGQAGFLFICDTKL